MSREAVYLHAKFLVELFPEVAIELLKDSRIQDKVEVRVNDSCEKLGNLHMVKGMIEARRFPELRTMKSQDGDFPSGPSPNLSPDFRTSPPAFKMLAGTPISMASGSEVAPRHEEIVIYQPHGNLKLVARSSSGDYHVIGEDKLHRLQEIAPNWGRPRKDIIVGRERLNVAQWVDLTWSRPNDHGTKWDKFWVVPPGKIQDADVLLASKTPKTGRTVNNGDLHKLSPMSLDRQVPPMPFVPTPPKDRELWAVPSSSGIHSHDSSPRNALSASQWGQGQNHMHVPAAAQRQSTHVSSGPPQLSSDAPQPPARPQSSQSTRTTKPFKPNAVMVSAYFQGKDKLTMLVDLVKNGVMMPPPLAKRIRGMKGDDLFHEAAYEMTVKPLCLENIEPHSFVLTYAELDDMWPAVIGFLAEHRVPEPDSRAEFLLDIGFG